MDTEGSEGRWVRFCSPFMNCSDSAREMRFMLLLMIAAAVFCAVVQLSGVHSSVIEGYFPYADAMFRGTFPYTDDVFVYGYYNVWEYPPLAYVFLLIPRLFSDNPYGYQIAYLLLMLVVIWIGMREVGRIAHILGKDHFTMVSSYFLLTLLFLEFVLDRFDMLVVVLCLIAVRMTLEEKYCGVAAVLAVGTLVKLFPIILVPIFAVYLISKKRWTVLGNAALSFIAVMLIAVPFAVIGDLSQMFGYHGNRPLEIECLMASVLNVIACLFPGAGFSWEFSYGSDNIVGGIADALGNIAEPLMFGILIVSYFVFWHICGKHRVSERTGIMCASMFAVCCFILLGSVFSGQYVIWLLPFVLVIAISGRNSEFFENKLFRLYLWTIILTQLNFLVNFGLRAEDNSLNIIGVLIILVRNVLVLWMMAETVRILREDTESHDNLSEPIEPVSGITD